MGKIADRIAAKANKVQPSVAPIKILAVRHCADGNQEFVSFQGNIGKSFNSKDALLRHICLKNWVHTPPAAQIEEYVGQTQAYAMFKQMGMNFAGIELHFYEVDEDRPNTYSCRQIMGIKSDAYFFARSESLAAELAAAGDYSVKRNIKVSY